MSTRSLLIKTLSSSTAKACRKLDHKHRASVGTITNGNRPLVVLYYAVRNREPKSGPLPDLLRCKERIKDTLFEAFGNARPGIAEHQLDSTIPARTRNINLPDSRLAHR